MVALAAKRHKNDFELFVLFCGFIPSIAYIWMLLTSLCV
jgi:hypothetical protein